MGMAAGGNDEIIVLGSGAQTAGKAFKQRDGRGLGNGEIGQLSHPLQQPQDLVFVSGLAIGDP